MPTSSIFTGARVTVSPVRDNHRGISLLSHAGKILARVLLNRLIHHLESNVLLPESQCGFRSGRGTADMIFAVRQLQEKCQEQNQALYLTFVDLTKAFDTVCRDGLWAIMKKYGCPPPVAYPPLGEKGVRHPLSPKKKKKNSNIFFIISA